jgi:hypothetical protein
MHDSSMFCLVKTEHLKFKSRPFYRKLEVDFILLSLQRKVRRALEPIKCQFVKFVRELAIQSHQEHFDYLKSKIQSLITEDTQEELIGGIIEELMLHGHAIESLLPLGKNAISRYHQHLTTLYYFTAPNPVLHPTFQNPERARILERLGFMLQAPRATLAINGDGSWLSQARMHNY